MTMPFVQLCDLFAAGKLSVVYPTGGDDGTMFRARFMRDAEQPHLAIWQLGIKDPVTLVVMNERGAHRFIADLENVRVVQ